MAFSKDTYSDNVTIISYSRLDDDEIIVRIGNETSEVSFEQKRFVFDSRFEIEAFISVLEDITKRLKEL